MYDAYISYRRSTGFESVILLHKALSERGLSCFCDTEYARTGLFPEDLKSKIASSKYFLLILTPNSLDRCNDENDWLYQEILTAIKNKISIIPIVSRGFEWPDELPQEIRHILYYQNIVLDLQYFDAFLDKLVKVNMGFHSIANNTKIKRDIPKGDFVFISYSTKDQDIADQTKKVLETNGFSCWMAPQSIPAGSDYGEEIPKAINNCKVFLLLLSQSSQDSNWVPKEVGQAIGKGKTVVPFQIDNAAIKDSFDFYLTNSQRISAYNRISEAYQELVKRLLDILS